MTTSDYNKEDIDIDLDAALDAAKEGKAIARAPVEIVHAEPEKEVKSPDQGIEELRAKLDEERQARIAAEKQAREYQQTAHQASTEVDDTHLHLVSSAIETVKRETSILKRQYAEAMAAKDFNLVADIQEAMAGMSVKLNQLEAGKTAMENRPKPEPVRPMPRDADPIEDIANQVTTKSAAWLRSNREHLNSDKTIRKMFRAHEDAVEDGIEADTPAYFQFIEQRLGISGPREDRGGREIDVSPEPAPVRRQAPPAAPVTRSGTANGAKSNIVRLSAEEREMASMMNMTDQEYAINKQALQKSGKLPN